MKAKYDYIIVGSGLFGATCANLLHKAGKTVLVIEKRDHIGGNIYTETIKGINVHKYGAHIFHTSNKEVWDYVNSFTKFNNFIHSPIANYKGELYNLPFNMNTFCQIWKDVKTPDEAKKRIEEDKLLYHVDNPKNLEEQAINLVGKTIYEKLIKCYTAKQWGRECNNLPAFIIKRLPVRFTFDNNYFSDLYQGIPEGGYTKLIKSMLSGVEIRLHDNYLKEKNLYNDSKIIYTGPIDEFFDYKYGPLEYRSLRFESEYINQEHYQSAAVMNFTDFETPYTRIIEHKYFENAKTPSTVITKEYPAAWKLGDEPYYPINDDANMKLYSKYEELAKKEKNVFFGGRLGMYKYFDMDKTIEAAFELINSIL